MLMLQYFRTLSLWLCIWLGSGLPLLSQQPGPLANAAADTLRAYVGIQETHGYNRSPMIDRMNRIAGVPYGSSWCMAFVVYGFHAAASARGIASPLLRTGSCARQLSFARSIGGNHGLRVIPLNVLGARTLTQRGDVVIAKRGGYGTSRDISTIRLGHCGVVDADDGATVVTIEGNTSPGHKGSQHNGDGAHLRTRSKRWWLAAIRIPV